VLVQYPEHLTQNEDFVQTFINICLPYESKYQIELFKENTINNAHIEALMKKHDLPALQSKLIFIYFNFQILILECDSFDSLMSYTILFFSTHVVTIEKAKKLFCSLNNMQKGIKAKELMELANITQSEFNLLIMFFKYVLVYSHGHYIILNEKVKAAIKATLFDPVYLKTLHFSIATVLENQPTTFMNLEEQVYHLACSQQYFKLKEKLSNTENFLLLYTANFKYDFCRYW